MREYKVYRIENGTVIDHIPHWNSLKVLDLLGLRQSMDLVTLGIGLDSRHMGRKDLVKVENREVSQAELDRLALVAPQATINLIRNSVRVEKLKVRVPDRIEGLVRCPNSGCITRHEYVPTRFDTLSREPLELRCYYCNVVFQGNEVELI
jgi:aspartate carbamoyltransferase regulatory subunit